MTVLIGVDPHKGSHTAVAIDRDEQALGELRVRSSKKQCDELLAWAARFERRRWAIESATGWGYLLARQLVAAGEDVVDVPPVLSARVRVLDSTRSSKNDPNDARSAAIVALRHRRLRTVVADDHSSILRMLANRHHQLNRLRTQAVNRLHSQLANLVAGGLPGRLSVKRAGELLESLELSDGVAAERKHQAMSLLEDVARLDAELAVVKRRIVVAVDAANTSVTDVYGVGPIVAAIVIGHTGDVGRFKTRDQFATYAATAPIDASTGDNSRHRLNTRGNRQLNHAMHMAAVTQVRNDTPGRAYYERKQAEGKTKKAALRSLKRRVTDAVYRQLVADAASHA